MILSFLLFLGFISFAFYFFSPFHNPRTLQSSLDYAFDEIVTNVSITLARYSMIFPGDCENKTIKFTKTPLPEGNIKMYDLNGTYIGGWKMYEGSYDWCFSANVSFVEILVSEEFTYQGATCPEPADTACGKVSSSENKKVISKKKLNALYDNYYNLSTQSYLDLKDSFNLPGSVNFGFSLISEEGGTLINAERNIPTNLEVISKKDRVEVVIDNKGVIFADLVVRVW